MSDGLEIHHNPVPAAERVARWHGVLRSRLIMLAISVVLSVAVFVWQQQKFNGLGIVLLAVFNLVPLVWVVVAAVYGQIAKRDLATVGEGVAMRIHRGGIDVDGRTLGWPQVRSVAARTRGPGRSPMLVVAGTDGSSSELAMEQLDVMPSQVDDALRAFTSGRLGLDLSATGV